VHKSFKRDLSDDVDFGLFLPETEPPPAATVTFIEGTPFTTNHTVRTVTHNIGAADPARDTILVCTGAPTGSIETTSTATMDDGGGATAMQKVLEENTSDLGHVIFFILPSTNGTTADFEITHSLEWARITTFIYRALNVLDVDPYDSAKVFDPTSGAPSVQLDLAEDGICIGAIAHQDSTTALSWTGGGLVEDYDQAIEATMRHGCASVSNGAPLVNETIQCTGGVDDAALGVVSWR
jgi:hypothetical protein